MKLWCGKCYDRLEATRPRCRMSSTQRFAIVRKALTEHGDVEDKGRYEDGRRITARCMTCGHRSELGYIISASKKETICHR